MPRLTTRDGFDRIASVEVQTFWGPSDSPDDYGVFREVVDFEIVMIVTLAGDQFFVDVLRGECPDALAARYRALGRVDDRAYLHATAAQAAAYRAANPL